MRDEKKVSNPKVSVIIPVYNVEEYLVKCLDSVCNQTLKEIEIICINDGSTDLSGEILKGYAQTDSRIKVIDKENEGQGIARNIGIEQAKGEYIGFVDPDDWIDLEMYEKLYSQAKKLSSEIVICDYVRYQSWTGKKWVPAFFEEAVSATEAKKLNVPTNKNIDKDLINRSLLVSSCYSWNRIYKRELLADNKIKFDAARCYEDIPFILYSHIKARNISYLNEALYIYRLNQKSTLRTRTDRYAIFLNLLNKLKGNLQKRNIYDTFKLNISYMMVMNSYWTYQGFSAKDKALLIKNAKTNLDKQDLYDFLIKIGKKRNLKKKKKTNIFQLIKDIQKKQKYYPKDTYLLFDCLHDLTVECIDAYSLFDYMRDNGFKAYYVVLLQSQLYEKLRKENKLENVIVLPCEISPDNESELLDAVKTVLPQTKCVLTSFSDGHPVANHFFKDNKYIQYVFLQHGMIFSRDSVLTNYIYPEQFDKFLISSSIEEKLFKKYLYADTKLIKSGLPRWDLLNDTGEKSILIMFTWRRLSQDGFEKSLYKENLLALISDERLINFANKNNIKIYFAPHHALKTNSKINFNISSPYIEVVDTQNISQYIKKCSCLITDFSSVAYDFIFQSKPAIFYPLDKGCKCLNKMEKEDLERFNYKQYILENVFNSLNEVIDKAIYYMKNNFVLEKQIKERYEGFFFVKENIRENLTTQLEKITATHQELVKNLPLYKQKYILNKLLSLITYGKLKEKFRQDSTFYESKISIFKEKRKIRLKRYSFLEYFISKKEKTKCNGDKVVHYRLFGISLFKSVQKLGKAKHYYLLGIKVA